MAQSGWKIFKTEADYSQGMARLSQLAADELVPETDNFDEFELLTLLIGHYEKKHFPMAMPDPIEAIKFRMDQQGLGQADMTPYFGSASKVSEVLNRKRPLSINMIRRLHDGLGIPADVLIQDMNAIDWDETGSPTADKMARQG